MPSIVVMSNIFNNARKEFRKRKRKGRIEYPNDMLEEPLGEWFPIGWTES